MTICGQRMLAWRAGTRSASSESFLKHASNGITTVSNDERYTLVEIDFFVPACPICAACVRLVFPPPDTSLYWSDFPSSLHVTTLARSLPTPYSKPFLLSVFSLCD